MSVSECFIILLLYSVCFAFFVIPYRTKVPDISASFRSIFLQQLRCLGLQKKSIGAYILLGLMITGIYWGFHQEETHYNGHSGVADIHMNKQMLMYVIFFVLYTVFLYITIALCTSIQLAKRK